MLHFLDTLLIVTVLLIPAFPSDHFDCCTPLLNFHLLHSLHVFKSWHSLAELLIVLLPGSTFVLAVPANTSVCGSHWQLFCLWLSLAVLFSVTLLLWLQRGFVWFTLPRPPPPLRLKIIFIKMSVYIKMNYPSEPSSIKFEPPFKNSPTAPLIVTLPGCTFGCDTLIM